MRKAFIIRRMRCYQYRQVIPQWRSSASWYLIAEHVHRQSDVLGSKDGETDSFWHTAGGGPFDVPSSFLLWLWYTRLTPRSPAWNVCRTGDTGYGNKRDLRCRTGNLSSKAVLYNSYVPKVSIPYGTCPARELPSPLYMSGIDVAAAALPKCNRVFIVSSG